MATFNPGMKTSIKGMIRMLNIHNSGSYIHLPLVGILFPHATSTVFDTPTRVCKSFIVTSMVTLKRWFARERSIQKTICMNFLSTVFYMLSIYCYRYLKIDR